ncbi:MAG: ATP-binding protein [Rikenellaceae bacterium]|nr:ATP-binding protein [Rikenellaceae bacterium]
MHRADRLALLGELAAGAAHEIRNPLTTIRSTIQLLSRDFREDPVKSEMAEELISEVERINKIVQGLLSFARPSELNITGADLQKLIDQTLFLAGNTLERQGIQVVFHRSTTQTTTYVGREQLKQVFLNIVLNAAEAMSGNTGREKCLTIGLEQGTSLDGYSSVLLISFSDTGPGIFEPELEKIFNPFYTAKEEGTGLGLAISYGIIHRHQGEIEVRSNPGRGTVFTIKLPQKK